MPILMDLIMDTHTASTVADGDGVTVATTITVITGKVE